MKDRNADKCWVIYIAKIILHHNSRNIIRILAAILNGETYIVNCNIY
ncbi:hypothetical protein BJV41_000679 [Clostridium beijerinckii]|nr:hypothetical protein [Clostridium beijerinckii]OOM41933.1 hypothetical protein CBEIJ_43900 [Clostridium beijerinckii]